MARGNNVTVPSGTGLSVKTLFGERQTVLILNPNNGVLYVRINSVPDPIAWDWVVPSQSRAILPGPWIECGLFYQDQGGAGAAGNITIFETDQKIDLPDYAAIGVSRLVQQTAMDIVEGNIPANPAGGILRLWADTGDHLHRLGPTNVDSPLMDSFTPLGGALSGFLPNPTLVNAGITPTQLANNAVSIALAGAGGGIPFSTTSGPYVPVGTAFSHNVSAGSQYFLARCFFSVVNTVLGAVVNAYLGYDGGSVSGGPGFNQMQANYSNVFALNYIVFNPTAATHNVQLYVAMNVGTTTINYIWYETLELRR